MVNEWTCGWAGTHSDGRQEWIARWLGTIGGSSSYSVTCVLFILMWLVVLRKYGFSTLGQTLVNRNFSFVFMAQTYPTIKYNIWDLKIFYYIVYMIDNFKIIPIIMELQEMEKALANLDAQQDAVWCPAIHSIYVWHMVQLYGNFVPWDVGNIDLYILTYARMNGWTLRDFTNIIFTFPHSVFKSPAMTWDVSWI